MLYYFVCDKKKIEILFLYMMFIINKYNMSSTVHSIAIESFDVSSMLQRRELEMCMEYARVILKDVCKKQGLDFAKVESEVVYPRLSKSSKSNKVSKKEGVKVGRRDVPSLVLPFLGVHDDWCKGVKRNRGLYTQCTTVARDGNLCGKCSRNQAFGLITSRVVGESEFEYNGKTFKVACYGDVMSKLNYTRDAVEADAGRFGWSLSEDDFKVSEKKRGRKKKDVVEEEVSVGSDEKKRGRPKKDKKIVSTNGDDLIARLVAEVGGDEDKGVDEEKGDDAVVVNAVSVAKAKKGKEESSKASKKQKESDKSDAAKNGGKVGGKKKEAATAVAARPVASKAASSDSESEEESAPVVMKVRKFEFEGKKYKLSSDNILYDWESDEPVGIWNPTKKCIEEYEDSSSEDEDEDDE